MNTLKLTLSIDSDIHSDTVSTTKAEVARILADVTRQVIEGAGYGAVNDRDGKPVGSWKYEVR